MIARWKQYLLISVTSITLVIGCYAAFVVVAQRKQGRKYETPEQAYARWIRRVQEGESRQPSFEEAEIVKMCFTMSYLTDKIILKWLREQDKNWDAVLLNIEPSWPRCRGRVIEFLELNPPKKREDVDEKLRRYFVMDGIRGEIVNYLTPIPWSAYWMLNWQNKAIKKICNVRVNWFRSSTAIDEIWPKGDIAEYHHIHGYPVAAPIRYAVVHRSFSGPIIGDDSFLIKGYCFFRHPNRSPDYKESEPAGLIFFRKYNFKCLVGLSPQPSEMFEKPPLEDILEDNVTIDKIARLLESQIIAYSLFSLDKFTILKVQADEKEFYLPAGRISEGNYLMPVRYVLERLTEKRPNYDANLKQMRVEVKGKEEIVKGEVIEATNKYFQIPEEERLVANWETIQSLLGFRKIKDIRFEE